MTITDYSLTVLNGLTVPNAGVWVRIVNNASGSAYVSTSATDPAGKWTTTAPPGQYTVYTGISNTGPWSAYGDANYTLAFGYDTVQSLAYTASLTVDVSAGETVVVGTLTGNITINAPTFPTAGQRLTIQFTQDGTGGRTVTWNAAFNTKWTPSLAANATSSVTFWYDGSKWQHFAPSSIDQNSTLTNPGAIVGQSLTIKPSGSYTPTTGLVGSIQAAAGVSVGTPATSHVPSNLVLTMNGPTIAAESAVVNDIIEFATNATFTGDFTHAWDNGSPDSGFVWGANIYSALGPATGDGVAITQLNGLAVGAVFQGPDARPALIVRGMEVSMHAVGAGATGTYLQAESLRVHAAGDQQTGATATPTNAYSLVIESPTKGTSGNFAVLQTGSASWWITGQLQSRITSAPGYDASVQVDAAARGKFRDNAGFTFTANSQTTASWVSEGSIPIDNSGGWTNAVYASFRSALGSAVHTGATGLSNAINFWAQSLYPAANASIRAGFAVGTVSEGGNWQFYGGTTDASKLKGNLILTADPGLTFSAAASRIIPGATSMSLRNTANSADNLILLDAGTATFRDNVLFGTTAKGVDTAAGIAELDIGITNATAIKLGNATSLVNFNWGLTAVGGGATATLGTIGGSGPATAAMNGWLKVNVNGTATFIPAWR